MNQQKSFMFYTSWESTFLDLTLEERWTFVHNLIKFHSNRENELEFPTRIDSLTWKGVLPALEINKQKWNERAQRSRENGSKNKNISLSVPSIIHGVGIIPTNTQQVTSEPGRPVNSKLSNGNSQMVIENSKQGNVNSEQLNINRQLGIEKSQLITDNDKIEDYHHLLKKVTDRSIEEIESILNRKFSSLPTWKKVLKSYGPKEFIEKYQHIINWSTQLSVDINKYYNKMVTTLN